MYRAIVDVVIFAALVCHGVGSQVCAQTQPALPTCPDFSGNYVFYEQKLRVCSDNDTTGEALKNSRSTGTLVLYQQPNPAQPALGIPESPYGCLFKAEKTTTWDNGVELTTPRITKYAGVFRSKTVIMQAVPKPATVYGDYVTPPVVVFGDITKTDKKTKAPTEIKFSWNANEGEMYDMVYDGYGQEGDGMTWAHHCAFTGSGMIFKSTAP